METKLSNVYLAFEPCGIKTTGNKVYKTSMKHKIHHLMPCDYGSVDQEGKVSAVGIFDVINVLEFPSIHVQMFVVLQITMTNDKALGEQNIVIKIIDPTGKELSRAEISIDGGDKKSGKANILAKLQLIKFEFEGEHSIEVWSGKKTIGTHKIEVRKNA